MGEFVVSGNPGDDCSSIVINGEAAAAASDYPEINIVQDISICNYNTANKVQLSNAADKKVETRFYHPTGDSQTNVSFESFKGEDLPNGQCLGSERDVVLSSRNVKAFMEAFLQGGQATTSGQFISGAFCYAYTFHRIDIGMFYPSLGECQMSVSTGAIHTMFHVLNQTKSDSFPNSLWSITYSPPIIPHSQSQTSTACELPDGTDCKDYINNSVDSCELFNATFFAKACNDNNRGKYTTSIYKCRHVLLHNTIILTRGFRKL